MTTTIRECITPYFSTLPAVQQYHELMKGVTEYAQLYADYRRHIDREGGPIDPEYSLRVAELYGKLCQSAWTMKLTAAREGR